MADFADSRVCPNTDEDKTWLPISAEKPADVASPYALSSSVPEAAKNDDKEVKTLHQSHGEALEKSWKLIISWFKLVTFDLAVRTIKQLRQPCWLSGNRSSENTCIEQEVSQYLTCNRMTALQGDKNDVDCARGSDRCGMHEDLLFDIMLWLPVASLLRFRSVCRLWCSLIDSSAFITRHYNNHNSNKSCLLVHHVVSSDNADYDSKFCLLSGNKYEVYSSLDYEQPWYSVNEITILNSCNGIVPLLNEESGDAALWNPATKQLRPLPKSSVYHQYLLFCNEMIVNFGFNFDPKSNDYKFVRILYHYENKHNNLVEVYSLRTDSWRIIHKDDLLPFQYIDSDDTIFKNGTCFWTGYTHHEEFSPILISFDLNNEVFETMPLPGENDPDSCRRAYIALDPINDKLCYIKEVNSAPSDIYHKYFEIWMLGECGVKESWKKICKFGPIGTRYERNLPAHVLGFSKNGEFLLQGYKYRSGELYLSNFDAQEEEHLRLQNPKPVRSKFVCYNESLVSLKREDDVAYK